MKEQSETRWPSWDAINMSSEEREELDLYRSQDRIAAMTKNRRADFEERMQIQRLEFYEKENQIEEERDRLFALTLRVQDITSTRNTMVPAYTFTSFPLLPKEIQLRIWSMASRFEVPRNYFILPTKLAVPSSIMILGESKHHRLNKNVPLYPVLLRVSQDSRNTALAVYDQMSCRIMSYWEPEDMYINTLYSRITMIARRWEKFRVLINIWHKLNGTTLDPISLANINSFAKIRFMMVGIHVFTHTPPNVWGHFERLEILTIAFDPQDSNGVWNPDHMDEVGTDSAYTYPTKPALNTMDGQRTRWLQLEATKILRTCKSTIPNWKPSVEVVLYYPGYDESQAGNSPFLENSPTVEMTLQYGSSGGRAEDEEPRERVPETDLWWYEDVMTILNATALWAAQDHEDWDGFNDIDEPFED